MTVVVKVAVWSCARVRLVIVITNSFILLVVIFNIEFFSSSAVFNHSKGEFLTFDWRFLPLAAIFPVRIPL